MSIDISIDGKFRQVVMGKTLLQACWEAGVYIPALCAHPDLSTSGVCGICLVESPQGKPVMACTLPVEEGASVITQSALLQELRRKRLCELLGEHPHVCLTCHHRDGCDRTECTLGFALEERCCERFGACEIQRVADYIGISPDTPRYQPGKFLPFQGDPVILLELERCIGCQRCVAACSDLVKHNALAPYAQNGRTLVRPAAGFEKGFKESGCRFCGACVEVCPAGAVLEYGKNGKRWREKTQAKLGLATVPVPPRKAYAFESATLSAVPDEPGVYRLWDQAGDVILIEGSPALHQSLAQEMMSRPKGVATYDYEIAQLYTQRANELLQMHLKKYGKLPAGNDLEDDLY